MVMQKPRDLPLWRGCLPEVGEGGRVLEEFPLDFGRKSAPSHDDGRSQTFQNFSVVPRSRIKFQICGNSASSSKTPSFDILAPILLRADMDAPPSSSHRAIAAAWRLTSVRFFSKVIFRIWGAGPSFTIGRAARGRTSRNRIAATDSSFDRGGNSGTGVANAICRTPNDYFRVTLFHSTNAVAYRSNTRTCSCILQLFGQNGVDVVLRTKFFV